MARPGPVAVQGLKKRRHAHGGSFGHHAGCPAVHCLRNFAGRRPGARPWLGIPTFQADASGAEQSNAPRNQDYQGH